MLLAESRTTRDARLIYLTETLSTELAVAACAHAIAVLAVEATE
jgi:hypothetical protein